VEAGPLFSGF